MDDSVKTLDDVLREYSYQEFELDVQLKEVLHKIESYAKNTNVLNKYEKEKDTWQDENNASLQRNRTILKELEIAKAKLRSLYCCQPATNYFNSQLKKFDNYIKEKYPKNKNYDDNETLN